ncbi:MAG: ATP-binding protein [Pseudomonadota bacterium]
MMNADVSTSPNLITTKSILLVRSIALLLGFTIAIINQWGFSTNEHIEWILFGLFLQAVWIFSGWVRYFRYAYLIDKEIFFHLFIDVVIVSGILVVSGGSSNPFISYFLVIITLSAINLGSKKTWLITLATLISYTGLLLWSQFSAHHDHHGFNLHLIGMWVNYFISAILIAYFVDSMSRALKDRERRLSRMREDILHNEQILAIGTLAAGTSHELGTPLSTIAIILNDIKDEGIDSLNTEDLSIMIAQVDKCRSILSRLKTVADYENQKNLPPITIQDYFTRLQEHILLIKPASHIDYQFTAVTQNVFISQDPTLEQALLNLIINAIEASQESVKVQVDYHETLMIRIENDGQSYTQEVLTTRNTSLFQSDKTFGLGLGFFLTNATIERMGGSVEVLEVASQGTSILVRLPANKNT